MGYIYDSNMPRTMVTKNIIVEADNEVMKTMEKNMEAHVENEIQVETRDVQKDLLSEVRGGRDDISGNSPYKHAFYCGHCGQYVPFFSDRIFSDRRGALRHLECGSILRISPHNKRNHKALRKQKRV
jgi:hypothetical protein